MARKALNKKNLVGLGADALAELLLEAVKGDAARQRRVRMALSADQSPQEAAADVRKRFASIRRSQSFISWKTQKKFAKELTDLVTLVEPGSAPTARTSLSNSFGICFISRQVSMSGPMAATG